MDGRMTDAEEALAPFSFLVSSLLFPEGGGIWRAGLWSLCVMLPLEELRWVGREEEGETGGEGEGELEEAEDRGMGQRKINK